MGILLGAAIAALLLLAVSRMAGVRGYGENRIGDRLKRLKANKRRYAVMTPELLNQTEDDLLLEAVLSNIWAKMAEDLHDMADVLSRETRDRKYIFSLYAVTGTVSNGGFEALFAGPDAALVPQCAEALEAIDMTACAQMLRKATGAGTGADAFSAPYLECFDALNGRERMVRFIRDNAGDFTDAVCADDEKFHFSANR